MNAVPERLIDGIANHLTVKMQYVAGFCMYILKIFPGVTYFLTVCRENNCMLSILKPMSVRLENRLKSATHRAVVSSKCLVDIGRVQSVRLTGIWDD